MRAIAGKQVAATLSILRRGFDGGDPNGQEIAESDEFRIVPYLVGEG